MSKIRGKKGSWFFSFQFSRVSDKIVNWKDKLLVKNVRRSCCPWCFKLSAKRKEQRSRGPGWGRRCFSPRSPRATRPGPSGLSLRKTPVSFHCFSTWWLPWLWLGGRRLGTLQDTHQDVCVISADSLAQGTASNSEGLLQELKTSAQRSHADNRDREGRVRLECPGHSQN